MNNKLFNVLVFAAGAAIGSVVTWKIVKTKYEQLAQEEIDSVKEVYSRRRTEVQKEEIKTNQEQTVHTNEKPNIIEYARMLEQLHYAQEHPDIPFKDIVDGQLERKEETAMNAMYDGPYVIPPDEFGEEDGYEAVSLNYYADGVLTDDWDVPIKDVEGMVGEDSLKHFGEYEDDSVFVRNDKLKIDFEILADVRNFSDVMREKEESAEDEDD